MSLRSRIRGGQDYLTDRVATAAQFLTLRLIPIGSTHMGCYDSDGPGHAPRYLCVRQKMKYITRSAKGRILNGTIAGLCGGISMFLASVMHRHYGLNIIISYLAVMTIFLAAIYPIQKRISIILKD